MERTMSTTIVPRAKGPRTGWMVSLVVWSWSWSWYVEMCSGCTNLLVTPGASLDGSAMIAYNADSASLMGMLYHYPAREATTTSTATGTASTTETNPGDSNMESTGSRTREVYDWDSGVYLGAIEDDGATYNVVGNTNEMGLVIAETTFGGIEALSKQDGAVMDYGSLIYVTLQRAKTAREAIGVMSDLMDRYGYASSGESFSLADHLTGEVWIMEVIGRGNVYGEKGKTKGAVWVAVRLPDGTVSAHANQARITTFPRDDPDHCLYSHDVVDLAVELGLYKRTRTRTRTLRHNGDEETYVYVYDDSDFSFSDVYDPVTPMGARTCEARVWSVLSPIADPGFAARHLDYVTGRDLSVRMPLYVWPHHHLNETEPTLLRLEDVETLMANHYEETELSMEVDVGAGIRHAPYRPRPLTWSYNGTDYANGRSVATQQTGWNFIAQVRSASYLGGSYDYPFLSSVLWFAVDDSSTAPRVPVYGCSTRVSPAYAGKGTQDGVPSPLLTFDLQKAFWIQNMVSNFAYDRWELVYPRLREKLKSVTERHQRMLREQDSHLLSMLALSSSTTVSARRETVIEMATAFSVSAMDALQTEWIEFYGELFVRHRDYLDVKEAKDDPVCGCHTNAVGFDDAWKERIVRETGSRYALPSDDGGGGRGGGDHSGDDKIPPHDNDDDYVNDNSGDSYAHLDTKLTGNSHLRHGTSFANAGTDDVTADRLVYGFNSLLVERSHDPKDKVEHLLLSPIEKSDLNALQ